MAWIYVLVASIFEITWAVALKFSAGFTKFLPSAVVFIAGALSFYFLALGVKSLPIGTAYGV